MASKQSFCQLLAQGKGGGFEDLPEIVKITKRMVKQDLSSLGRKKDARYDSSPIKPQPASLKRALENLELAERAIETTKKLCSLGYDTNAAIQANKAWSAYAGAEADREQALSFGCCAFEDCSEFEE